MENQQGSQIFSDYTLQQSETHTASKSFMANVFLWMFGALLVSAGFAYAFSAFPELQSYLVDERGLTLAGKATIFAPLGFVLLMSFGYQRLSAPVLAGLFIVYAAITGMSLSFILARYTGSSVLGCFVSSAAMFGVMGVMGYTTNKDLTSFGRIMTMGLIGIVIASLVNLFMRSGSMEFIISFIGIAVFTGLTAYDVQKLKRIGAGIEYEGMEAGSIRKMSIMGALNLYLDFINIFLFMLRLFGSRK